MSLRDFTSYCADLTAHEFTVHDAQYSGDAFGSWAIDFSSQHVSLHRLTWDGRDRWPILQEQRPNSERNERVTIEDIRRMNYVDGVVAKSHLDSNKWKDRWIGKGEAEQTLERVLQELDN